MKTLSLATAKNITVSRKVTFPPGFVDTFLTAAVYVGMCGMMRPLWSVQTYLLKDVQTHLINTINAEEQRRKSNSPEVSYPDEDAREDELPRSTLRREETPCASD